MLIKKLPNNNKVISIKIGFNNKKIKEKQTAWTHRGPNSGFSGRHCRMTILELKLKLINYYRLFILKYINK